MRCKLAASIGGSEPDRSQVHKMQSSVEKRAGQVDHGQNLTRLGIDPVQLIVVAVIAPTLPAFDIVTVQVTDQDIVLDAQPVADAAAIADVIALCLTGRNAGRRFLGKARRAPLMGMVAVIVVMAPAARIGRNGCGQGKRQRGRQGNPWKGWCHRHAPDAGSDNGATDNPRPPRGLPHPAGHVNAGDRAKDHRDAGVMDRMTTAARSCARSRYGSQEFTCPTEP